MLGSFALRQDILFCRHCAILQPHQSAPLSAIVRWCYPVPRKSLELTARREPYGDKNYEMWTGHSYQIDIPITLGIATERQTEQKHREIARNEIK